MIEKPGYGITSTPFEMSMLDPPSESLSYYSLKKGCTKIYIVSGLHRAKCFMELYQKGPIYKYVPMYLFKNEIDDQVCVIRRRVNFHSY